MSIIIRSYYFPRRFVFLNGARRSYMLQTNKDNILWKNFLITPLGKKYTFFYLSIEYRTHTISVSRICHGCIFAFGSFNFSNTFYEVSVCLHAWIAVAIDVLENTCLLSRDLHKVFKNWIFWHVIVNNFGLHSKTLLKFVNVIF